MEKYNKFSEQYKLIEYDVSKKDIREKLLKDNVAYDICRQLVHIETIEDVLCCEDIKGYIAVVKNKYVGFVLFKQNYDILYLSLIGTMSKLGFPLGQILLTKMEEMGKFMEMILIQGSSLSESIGFYKKMNYEVVYYDPDSDEYFIRKNINISLTF